MWAGYNIQEIGPKDESTRGDAENTVMPPGTTRRSSGFAHHGVLRFFRVPDTWSDPQTQRDTVPLPRAQMKRTFSQSSSIIIWNTSPNY